MSYPPPGGTPDPYGQQPGQPDPYATSGPPASGAPYDQYAQYPGQYGQYGQYGQPYPGYAPVRGTNIMAILSLVFAFVFAPVGIVLGHMAKKQIAQTGEEGGGMATAGLVVSYIFTGFMLLGCCAWVAVFVVGLGAAGTGGTGGY